MKQFHELSTAAQIKLSDAASRLGVDPQYLDWTPFLTEDDTQQPAWADLSEEVQQQIIDLATSFGVNPAYIDPAAFLA